MYVHAFLIIVEYINVDIVIALNLYKFYYRCDNILRLILHNYIF